MSFRSYLQMTQKQTLYLLISFLLLPALGLGQVTDSLEQLLVHKKLSDAEKLKIYDDLNWKWLTSDVQRSLDFGKKGLALALKTNDHKMQAVFYKGLGTGYYIKGDLDSALLELDKGQPVVGRLKDYQMEASYHNAYANIYRAQGQYDQSLQHYFAAANIYDNNNRRDKLPIPYGNIAGVYQVMKNYDQAIKYFTITEGLAREFNDQEGLAGVYLSMCDISLEQNQPKDSSVNYGLKAVEIFQSLGNELATTNARLTLAKVYARHKDYIQSEKIALEAVTAAQKIGMPVLLAKALMIRSNALLNQKKFAAAARLAAEVLATDSTDKNITRNVYYNLAVSSGYLGASESFLDYMGKYKDISQLYTTQQYHQAVSDTEVRYETEKKQLKIDALEKQHRLFIWLGIAGVLVLLALLAFALVRYRLAVNKRKLADEKARRLEQEKQLVAVQAALDGEASERSRLARDLHDGLGSMLSMVKVNLPVVRGNAFIEEVDASRFQTALGMLDDSIKELRRVAHHMMPESLLRFGLRASLADFCQAIPIAEFHYFGNEQRLEEKMEIMIYRCIHELVNNALKHAAASQIHVQLVQETDRISFTVQDDGKGFDRAATTEGMGLKNVRQRVTAFGGELNIYSSGQGTEIHVDLVIKKDSND
ncbi:hypothetical protein GCM10027051_33630 [Niabella terrae]